MTIFNSRRTCVFVGELILVVGGYLGSLGHSLVQMKRADWLALSSPTQQPDVTRPRRWQLRWGAMRFPDSINVELVLKKLQYTVNWQQPALHNHGQAG